MTRSSEITIRRVHPDRDEDARHSFLEMQDVCFPKDYCMAPHEDDKIAWWFAYDDVEPAGFACLTQGYADHTLGYLAWAGVMPDYRGLGIQRKLIRVRLQECASRGYVRALTYTLTTNPKSSNNLIACGFRLHTPSVPYATGQEELDVLYWQKKPILNERYAPRPLGEHA